jgi:beta-xylosidase
VAAQCLFVPVSLAKAATTYQNPVIKTDFPDPDVIMTHGTYYAYATSSGGKNIQVASSTDFVHWTLLPDALPTLPSWSSSGLTWAPSVIQIGNQFVMYYTTHSTALKTQCVSVATSNNPAGPFSDTSTQPLVCQSDKGGTIDPMPLADHGALYLYFKNDGNSIGQTTTLWAQRLTANGLRVIGQPTSLISNNPQSWEGAVIEAPFMFPHQGGYYLFYSGNSYVSNYAEGYATCRGPLGPCQKAANNPIMKSQSHPPIYGPGGASLIQIGPQTWIVYHTWAVNADGSQGNYRTMDIDRVNWVNGAPVVQGPTTTPQPGP